MLINDAELQTKERVKQIVINTDIMIRPSCDYYLFRAKACTISARSPPTRVITVVITNIVAEAYMPKLLSIGHMML